MAKIQCTAIVPKTGKQCQGGAQQFGIKLCGPHFTKYQKDPNSVTFVEEQKEETNVVRLKRDKTEPEPTIINVQEIYDTWKEEGERVDHCTDPECDAFITSQHDLEVHLRKGDHTYPKGHDQHKALVMTAREALKKAEEKAQQKVRIMVTGQRNTTFEPSYTALKALLERAIEKYGRANVEGIAGGAKGADYIWAKVLKDMEVPFKLYLPHPDYYEHYYDTASRPCSRENWTRLINAAMGDPIYSVEEGDFHWSYNHTRNADMIDASDMRIVVAGNHPNILLRQRRGGTANAVKQMRTKGITHVWFIQNETGNTSWVRLQEVW